MMILVIGLICSILLLSNEGSGSFSDNFSSSVSSGSSSNIRLIALFS